MYIKQEILNSGFSSVGASPPTDVTAVQDGPTSIRVSWAPPSPLGDTSGYRIYYTGGGGSSDSVDINGFSNTHTLMYLANGETYTISIVGRSSTSSTVVPSPPVSAGDVALGSLLLCYKLVEFTFCSLPQYHQLQTSMTLQQSLPLPSESLAVFAVAQ